MMNRRSVGDRRGASRDRSRARTRRVRSATPRRSASRSRGRLRSWSRSEERHRDDVDKARSTGADARKAADAVAAAKLAAAAGKPMRKVRKELLSRELGYKDDSNPFGDTTLTEKFTWKKKNEYLQAAGLYRPTSKDQELERVEAKIREIHSVKKRRDEREVERQLLEQQRQEHDKDIHDEEYGEWLRKEEHFHLNNAKVRSLIRIEQGRERPIDLVAKGLAIAEGEEFEDMTILDKPPHQLFATMGLPEIEDVHAEIENFVRNDTLHTAFWKAMLYVCQEAAEAKQREKAAGARAGTSLSGLGAGVAEGVVADIHELLSSKSRDELDDMLIEIKGSIQKGAEGMDTQFFEAVASKIPLYVARAQIEEWHERARKRSEKWMEENKPDDDSSDEAPPPAATTAKQVNKAKVSDWDDVPDGVPQDRGDFSPVLEPLSVLEEKGSREKGAFSPILEPISGFDPEELLDPEEDERIMRQVRKTITEAFREPEEGGARGSAGGQEVLDQRGEELLAAERARGIGKDEAAFNAKGKGMGDDVHGEIDLPQRHYEWEDKYRPRKPRFFNRVKTGYEWNKYNQTHYDHDNPPPKMVQGYKFNIFYPDLIDKAKAPTYFLEKGDSAETVTLRFHAGPPYEDVAFKIVNREWHLSHKFGFRVVFDRGVLQLYFNFKRWRYRR
mmetsp:Transcript_14932/g.32802  ORF Transcript_14932/g.32802 Transcript_14932/m.32802 type:complete len:672 (+) Transcript_14932:68-2083(+)